LPDDPAIPADQPDPSRSVTGIEARRTDRGSD